jgi:exonuclease III
MGVRFGTWNVRSLCKVGSLRAVISEMTKHKLDLVGVQEVRWVEGGSQPADNYTFLYGNGNADHHLGTGFFVYKGIVSSFKRIEFISDRMMYITL